MSARISPEAIAEEAFRVSIVQLVIEAHALMHGAAENDESVKTWRRVIAWLESKLPEGVTVDDLAPTANDRRAVPGSITTAADAPIEPGNAG